jgi:hypothetical protein
VQKFSLSTRRDFDQSTSESHKITYLRLKFNKMSLKLRKLGDFLIRDPFSGIAKSEYELVPLLYKRENCANRQA